MSSCPKCGSHRIRRVHHPLSPVVKTVSGRHRYRCSNCEWSGWMAHSDFEGEGRGSGARGQGSSRHHRIRSRGTGSKPPLDLGLEEITAGPAEGEAATLNQPLASDEAPAPSDSVPAPPPGSDVNTFRRVRRYGHSSQHHLHHDDADSAARRKRQKTLREIALAALLALALLASVWIGLKACATIAPPPEASLTPFHRFS